MHAPVDQSAAAGDGFGGERTAQTRDAAVGAEADVHVEHVAQLAGIDVLLDQVDAVVEAVDHAYVEHLARLMLHLLHLERFLIGAGSGLLAQDMFARP